MNYNYVLFDLDGTLTDPKVGITKSVAYSLKKMRGLDIDPDSLTKFIGPPLMESYAEYYKFSQSEAHDAIEYYREYFKDKGIFENEIYDGIEEVLKELRKRKGLKIAVATSKPTVFAEAIIEHFSLGEYFDEVVGSNLDGTRSRKSEVIEEVLRRLEVEDRGKVIMVGDRRHDIIGAKEAGTASLGVEYGYGDYEELRGAEADYIVKDMKALKEFFIHSRKL